MPIYPKPVREIPVGTSSYSLIVLGDAPERVTSGTTRKRLRVLCECGVEFEVDKHDFVSGRSRNCGCVRREKMRRIGKARRKHGGRQTRTWEAWKSMMRRCTNPRDRDWLIYGGRGIKVCEPWKDFATFFAEVGLPPSPAHTFGRLNEDGHFEPRNCKWETQSERRLRKDSAVVVELAPLASDDD
jgi:hypothetical protein